MSEVKKHPSYEERLAGVVGYKEGKPIYTEAINPIIGGYNMEAARKQEDQNRSTELAKVRQIISQQL